MGGLDQRVLDALTQAVDDHQELAAWLSLWRDIITAQLAVKTSLPPVTRSEDDATIRQRLEAGLPQAACNGPAVDAEHLASLGRHLLAVLVQHGAFPVEEKEQAETLTAGDWLGLAREALQREPSRGRAVSLDGAFFVDLALAPFLERAAEVIMPRLDLALWHRGYCPICGAAPDFALLDRETGARRLVCSRCHSEWPYARVRCPFCGTTDPTKLHYYLGEDRVYRLYGCALCQRYIKTMDLRQTDKEVLIPLERILTVPMDVVAQQQGYVAW